MNRRALLTLAGATVAVLAIALVAPHLGGLASLIGQPYLDDLDNRLDDARVLELVQGGETLRIEQQPATGGAAPGWVIASAANAPANAGQVRGALLGLARLKVEETKTGDPARMAELGLDGTATRVRILDGAGAVLADARFGKAAPGGADWVFARKAGAGEAVTVRGWPGLDGSALRWTTLTLPSIAPDRIASIDMLEPDGQRLRFAPATPAGPMRLTGLKPGEVANEQAADDLARNFSRLAFRHLRTARAIDWTASRLLILHTGDGLEVTVQVTRSDGAVWIRLNAVARPQRQGLPPSPAVIKEARAINDLRRQAFGVSTYVGEGFLKPRADFLVHDSPPVRSAAR